MTFFVHARIGIDDGGYHPRNPGIDQRLGARRCAAVMGARFERHIGCCSTRPLACFLYCDGFGMGSATHSGNATPDDDRAIPLVLRQQTGNRGVGAGAPLIGTGKPDGRRHEALMNC